MTPDRVLHNIVSAASVDGRIRKLVQEVSVEFRDELLKLIASQTKAIRPPPSIVVAIVGCGAAKTEKKAQAKDLYTGSLFKAARKDVEGRLRWFIASAWHDLVQPTDVLEPYDFRIEQIPAGSQREIWASKVAGLLARSLRLAPDYGPTPSNALTGVHIELHAGSSYSVLLVPALVGLGATVDVLPPGSMEIGYRLQWYSQRAKERKVRPHPHEMLQTRLKIGTRVMVKGGAKKGQVGVVEEFLSDPMSNEAITGAARYGIRMESGSKFDYRRCEVKRAR